MSDDEMSTEDMIAAILVHVSAIDTSTQLLLEKVQVLPAKPNNGATAKSSGGEVADDADLDGKYGDEDIRKDPSAKYWKGDTFVGQKMSECTAEYLDAVAKYRDACAYMNEKSGDVEKAKYIGYDRKSARRARGWAARIRNGLVKPASASGEWGGPPSDDDIPF